MCWGSVPIDDNDFVLASLRLLYAYAFIKYTQ